MFTSKSSFNERRACAAWAVHWLFALTCGCSHAPAAPESKSAAPEANAAASAEPAQAEAKKSAPFSGEIVYARQMVPDAPGVPSKPLGEFHYFISGPHYKHVDEQGDVSALYDPTANVLHYFKPTRRELDARQPNGEATIELLPEVKVILGHTCRGIRQVTRDTTFVVFFDPEIYVDPKDYADHHYGHWAEFLAATHGGLALWSSVHHGSYSQVSEAVRIVPRTFDASFWAVPTPEDQPFVKIWVSKKGEIKLDGKPVDLAAVDAAFTDLAQRKGIVLYGRDDPKSEPHPKAMKVMELLTAHRLPIRMSTKPDFSDAVGPDGNVKE